MFCMLLISTLKNTAVANSDEEVMIYTWKFTYRFIKENIAQINTLVQVLHMHYNAII